MKRSEVLYRVVITIVATVMIAGFTIPQEVLNNYELLFLIVAMPVLGWLWIQAYSNAMKSN